MSNWEKAYARWIQTDQLDRELRATLIQLAEDKEELQDAFTTTLTFGDEGIYGMIGPGTNRMNMFTVRRAIKGLAYFLEENQVNYKDRGVVVAYDSRHMSQEFALECAKVLGYHGIKTYVFQELRPSPLLSFAVRYLGAVAGIMITGNHHSSSYNGLKIYNEAGSQITSQELTTIAHYMNQVEDELSISVVSEDHLQNRNLLEWINGEIDHAYLEKLLEISKMEKEELEREKDLEIVFTPLHGTAANLVSKGLEQLQFQHIHYVESQMVPNPDFQTIHSLNLDDGQVFIEAMKLGKQKNADILLATDLDADRMGIAVKKPDESYQVLTGNQLGSLLLDYILQRTDPQLLVNARIIKSIVTTDLGKAIANKYGVQTLETLMGFQYIGEKVNEFDATGETFVFGYEASYDYLINTFSRDKDGVQAAVMACEMVHFWKEQGFTLLDRLDQLYKEYGYYKESMGSVVLEEKLENQQMEYFVTNLQKHEQDILPPLKIVAKEDYQNGVRSFPNAHREDETIYIPRANVVKYYLEDQNWICLSLSETETKMKWYCGVRGSTEEEANQKINTLKKELQKIILQPIV